MTGGDSIATLGMTNIRIGVILEDLYKQITENNNTPGAEITAQEETKCRR